MAFWAKIFGLSNTLKNLHEPRMGLQESLQALRHVPIFFKMIWRTHPAMTLANFLLRLLQAAIPLSMLYVGKLIIDEVLLLQKVGEASPLLWQYVGLEFGLALLSNLLSRVINLLDGLLGDLYAHHSSIALMQHAARLDLPQFENALFYDKLERARQQTSGRVLLISQIFIQLQELLTMFFLGAGLLLFNPWLILLVALAAVPSFLGEWYFNRFGYSLARSWTPERRELDYLRFVGATDDTAKELKIFNLSDFLTTRYAELSMRYYHLNKKLSVQRATWGTLFNTLGDVGYYGAYVLIIFRTIAGILSIGDLTFLAGSFARLRSTLQGILTRFTAIAQNALYLQDYFDFFEIQPQIDSPPQPQPLPNPIREGFTFENVGFKYPQSNIWALRHISFHLHPGEKLALVGENGAGKTTLVKLLARLYDPDEGRILLDGVDIRQYDLQAYRQLIGVIFQDFIRFQLKAFENIAIGKIEAQAERPKIEQAAAQSLADSVIAKLPEGYEQMLGKRFHKGVELSGGEWQKVALARAYMRDAALVILDEPTAALDAKAEYEVFVRFSELTQGKAAVLISHRFSTVRMADRILVLRKGEMHEIGSHEELMQAKGLYYELFSLQARGYL